MSSTLPATEAVVSVSELNRRARALLENGFPPLWVIGEVSNLTRHASGHWYFSLKDEKAQVRCVMFRHRNQWVDFELREGVAVEARAVITLYEPRGDFQLNVENLRPAGAGALFEAFLRLKARLEAEGLFAPERKRRLPAFPRAVGVVTSPQAAALRDVLTTLRRRMPRVPVIVYPTPVQGKGAADKIARAIRLAASLKEVDVLILCRGGGSLEDLWEFNEEVVARAIAASPIPVISGVGHETDFTIADFVADVRAPTPTAAATLAVPDRAELLLRIEALATRLFRRMRGLLETRMQYLDLVARRLVHPAERLARTRGRLDELAARLVRASLRELALDAQRLDTLRDRLWLSRPDTLRLATTLDHLATRLLLATEHRVARWRERLLALASELAHLDPEAVLARGYSIVRDAQGQLVRDAAPLALGETLSLTFARGQARARVIDKRG